MSDSSLTDISHNQRQNTSSLSISLSYFSISLHVCVKVLFIGQGLLLRGELSRLRSEDTYPIWCLLHPFGDESGFLGHKVLFKLII